MNSRNSCEAKQDFRRETAALWGLAVMTALLRGWQARHFMNPDGISYLDIADAYLRGDWKNAVNAYWSPLYSWLLAAGLFVFKPSPHWEFPVVQLMNFIIYLLSLIGFHFFMSAFMSKYSQSVVKRFGRTCAVVPERALWILGYSLFIWSQLRIAPLSVVSPDLLVSGLVYSAAGLLLRIREKGAPAGLFIALGVILGLGYLAKSVMWYMGFVFLGMSFFLCKNPGRSIPRVLTTLVLFLLTAGPFVTALSNARGRFTIGDVGAVAYAWLVNGVTGIDFYEGKTPESGTPRNPVRKLFEDPEVYEFATPFKATYPIWYDPSYWWEGIRPRFNFKDQTRKLGASINYYFEMFYRFQLGLVLGALILFLAGGKGWKVWRDLAGEWILLVPVILVMGAYALVWTDKRFLAPWLVLFWLAVFASVRLNESGESKRLVRSVVTIVLLFLGITLSPIVLLDASAVFDSLVKGGRPQDHAEWQLAETLTKSGLLREDPVAHIGDSFSASWARQARVRIIAEVPHHAMNQFWFADDSTRSRVLDLFKQTGAKAVVATGVPEGAPLKGWHRVSGTFFYLYLL